MINTLINTRTEVSNLPFFYSNNKETYLDHQNLSDEPDEFDNTNIENNFHDDIFNEQECDINNDIINSINTNKHKTEFTEEEKTQQVEVKEKYFINPKKNNNKNNGKITKNRGKNNKYNSAGKTVKKNKLHEIKGKGYSRERFKLLIQNKRKRTWFKIKRNNGIQVSPKKHKFKSKDETVSAKVLTNFNNFPDEFLIKDKILEIKEETKAKINEIIRKNIINVLPSLNMEKIKENMPTNRLENVFRDSTNS